MNAVAFEYRAVDRAGKRQQGVARAPSRETAYRQVVAMGLTPTLIRPVQGDRSRKRGRVDPKALTQFTNQLACFVEARIPLSEALAAIGEQEEDVRFRAIVTGVATAVQSGQPLSAAMAEHHETFGEVYIESVRAAEHSGSMTQVLALLAEMLERMDETRRQVRSALLYPTIVVGTLGLAVAFLVAFVVPRFAKMFDARGVQLPMLTRVLVAVGVSARNHWPIWLGVVAALAVAVRALSRAHAARVPVDALLHRLPFVRTLLQGLGVARFTRVLGMCLASGLGLIESLVMSGRASGRPMLQADVHRLAEQVRVGGRLSDLLPECGYLPAFVRRMLSAGEQSGELPRMCHAVARQYERETAQLSRNLGTVIEPVLVVLIAGVVLLVALSIFLPMWDMVKVMS